LEHLFWILCTLHFTPRKACKEELKSPFVVSRQEGETTLESVWKGQKQSTTEKEAEAWNNEKHSERARRMRERE
jgi:hypothetical protein